MKSDVVVIRQRATDLTMRLCYLIGNQAAEPQAQTVLPKPGNTRQYGLFILAAAFAVVGQWRLILDVLLLLSPSALSTVAAVACLAVALWPYMVAITSRWAAKTRVMACQLWEVVCALVSAILRLPDCARDIRLALYELEDVCHTLKCIQAKVNFLPGQPRDRNGRLIKPPPINKGRTL